MIHPTSDDIERMTDEQVNEYLDYLLAPKEHPAVSFDHTMRAIQIICGFTDKEVLEHNNRILLLVEGNQ